MFDVQLRFACSPPRIKPLGWLVDPRLDVSPSIKASLCSRLLASPWTMLVAVLNGLMVNAVALGISLVERALQGCSRNGLLPSQMILKRFGEREPLVRTRQASSAATAGT